MSTTPAYDAIRFGRALECLAPQERANLVRCVNSHERLVSACRLMLEVTGGPSHWNGETQRALIAIEAAVNSATGSNAQHEQTRRDGGCETIDTLVSALRDAQRFIMADISGDDRGFSEVLETIHAALAATEIVSTTLQD